MIPLRWRRGKGARWQMGRLYGVGFDDETVLAIADYNGAFRTRPWHEVELLAVGPRGGENWLPASADLLAVALLVKAFCPRPRKRGRR